jgi:hypothetical protein
VRCQSKGGAANVYREPKWAARTLLVTRVAESHSIGLQPHTLCSDSRLRLGWQCDRGTRPPGDFKEWYISPCLSASNASSSDFRDTSNFKSMSFFVRLS